MVERYPYKIGAAGPIPATPTIARLAQPRRASLSGPRPLGVGAELWTPGRRRQVDHSLPLDCGSSMVLITLYKLYKNFKQQQQIVSECVSMGERISTAFSNLLYVRTIYLLRTKPSNPSEVTVLVYVLQT